jgi:starch phosphorylase
VVDAIRDGVFASGDDALLRGIWSALMEHGDRYMHLADFRSYLDAHRKAEALYADRRAWTAAAIRNIVAMGSRRTARSGSTEDSGPSRSGQGGGDAPPASLGVGG